MRIQFTEEQKQRDLNKIEVEDVLFTADFIEGEGRNWVMTGTAIVEGEVYDGFCIEFETIEVPCDNDIETIMSLEWDTYDFVFDI